MAASLHRTKPDPKLTGWPPGIPYIIGNEGCERFSYYGMRAILYVYVVSLYVNLLKMPPEGETGASNAARATTHLFFAAVYALPIIGAIISDRLLGKYRTILSLSVVYCLGHAALALFENPALQRNTLGTVLVGPEQGLYLGLTLIAIGSGGIKPCVSAHVGDQFGKGNWHLLPKVFNAFYFIINFGSAFATILMPLIRGKRIDDAVTGEIHFTGSLTWAFAIPGILMGLATLFFWMGRRKFIHVPPAHPGRLGLLDVLSGSALFMVIGYPIFFHQYTAHLVTAVISAGCFGLFVGLFSLRQWIKPDDGFLAVLFFCVKSLVAGHRQDNPQPKPDADPLEDHWFFGPAARTYGVETTQGPVAVLRIMSVFVLISVFWALFDQHSSTWIEQAEKMQRNVHFSLLGWIALGGGLGLIVGGGMAMSISKTRNHTLAFLAAGGTAGAALGLLASNYGPYDIQPSQVAALNPFMVMVLIPYTMFGLYPLMEKLGFEPTPLRRMTIGMFMASLSFVTVAILQNTMDTLGTGKVHVGWQLVPYVIITLAEVMLSITGLEFAYRQAPKRMKSVIMGFWSFNVTLGNLLVVYLTELQKKLSLATFFWTFAGLMALAAMLFGLRAAFYKYQDYTQ